jgi:hypothetical protein
MVSARRISGSASESRLVAWIIATDNISQRVLI